ncbi:MAG: HAD-IIB family hydrolase [Deltaproteobacteria bacterium]|nr:HAD-IIB family hydrolase [Deltaproteobacteria bacterium]
MVIFTDLDGTLLNHEDYSFEEARPSLERIGKSAIPLIVVTSKTRLEVELLQREIGIREPFIVENGGGIFFPCGYLNLDILGGEPSGGYTLIRLGTHYTAVRSFLETVRERFGIRGFGDLTSGEIAGLAALPPERAELAKRREFTEPFLLERPDDIEPLCEIAGREGLKITRGGRFYHLIGIRQDKGKAVRIVCEIFRKNTGDALMTIGLGDSENDLPMLEQVDIPVLIPRPNGRHLDIQLPRLIRATELGCRGWNETVRRLLDDYEKVGPV